MSHDGTEADNETAIVQAWHDALNSGDLDRLVTLMRDDVEFGGPLGSGRGAQMVRDWAERAGIRLEPARWFQQGADVVVTQRARWLSSETRGLGPPQDIASVFQISHGTVQRVVRYRSLPEAFAACGLDESVEVSPPGP
jgi:hypothetical protein